MLVKEGWTTSRKFVQAVRRSEGVQVKPPKKRRPRQGISTGSPTKANSRNHVWSWDFVHDRTDNGGMLKMMTLIDEYTRKCLRIRVARQLTSTDVLSVLSKTIDEEGVPELLVVYVVLEPKVSREKKVWKLQIQNSIKTHINPLFRIFDIVLIDIFPRTASNKIMRRELRSNYKSQI